ncbi:MAG: EamA family transporter [Rhodobacteraceae bacterium]|nr:EamA family transporter [Paracoccaceae bacterium]
MQQFTPKQTIMALFVPLLWGLGFVFAKGAINHFPPILLMAFRFSLTALVLVWFTPLPFGKFFQLFKIAIVAAAIQYSLTFTGVKGLEAGLASIIVQLEVPFLVILGALFLREKPGYKKWIGIAISFVGVATWALGQVMIRKLKDVSGMQVTAWIAVFAAPQLFFMSAIFEDGQVEAIRTATPLVWWTVLYLGLIMTCLGYYFWNTLIRHHDVSKVAPFLLLLPVFSVLGGNVFLGETITIEKFYGGVTILLGIGVITINARLSSIFSR